MERQLFNSPEKQWVRENFWLPAIMNYKSTRITAEIKYLTFAGPEGFDIDFFSQKNVVLMSNVRVWETNSESAERLKAKFGPTFNVVLGEAFDLAGSRHEKIHFPHQIINLDFTNGAFHLRRPRYIPPKFETLHRVILAQRECTESFLLLTAFAATADVDNDVGKAFVHKLAFDIATRFGYTEPLFNLTRDPQKFYPHILASLIPCAVVRIGGDQFYDTQCLDKALYFPYNSKKTAMVCFVFLLTFDNPALSETSHQTSNRMDKVVMRRQEESLKLPLVEVNKVLRQSAGPRRRQSQVEK